MKKLKKSVFVSKFFFCLLLWGVVKGENRDWEGKTYLVPMPGPPNVYFRPAK
jgi:hypothetical protein